VGVIEQNDANIAARTTALRTASNAISVQELDPTDGASTISANRNAQGSFQTAQEGHNLLADALTASATQITEIWATFNRVDGGAGAQFGPNQAMTR